MKKLIAIFLALCLVLAFAACSTATPANNADTTPTPTLAPSDTKAPSDTPSSGESSTGGNDGALSDQSPLKIGLICDLTGNEATTGQVTQEALEFAIKHFGDIGGKNVELVVEDAGGDAAAAADKTRKMVEEDGVHVVFGPTQAGQKAAVVAYCDEAEVPLIFANGTPSYLFNTSNWLIGSGGANPQMTSVIADYVYNELGYRKVHILTMDNTGFRTFSDDFSKSFTALGGEIGEEYYVPFSVGDWSSYFAAMSTDGIDGIMAWSTGATAISLWKSYNEMGMNEKLPISAILSSAFTDYYICNALEASGSGAAEDILGTIAPAQYSYDIDTPENAQFIEDWTAEFGEIPNMNLSGLVFDAYQVVVEAVKATDGDTSAEPLRDAMLAVDFNGVSGHIVFPASGAAARDTYIVKVVKLDDGSYNYSVVTCYEDVPPEGLQ